MKISQKLFFTTFCILFSILSHPILSKHKKLSKARKLNEDEYEDTMAEQNHYDLHDHEPNFLEDEHNNDFNLNNEENNTFGDQIVEQIKHKSLVSDSE